MKLCLLFSTFFISLTLLVSCGRKGSVENTGTNFIISGAVVAGSGGIIVFGKHNNQDLVFSKVIAGEELSIDLPNGSWDFLALAWDGADNFSGTLRCAKQEGIVLSGGDQSLNMTLSATNCQKENVIGQAHTKSGLGQPNTISIRDCVNSSALIQGDNDSCINGSAGSYKLSLPIFDLGSKFQPYANAFSSNCLTEGATNVRLPIFNDSEGIMGFIVDSYSGGTCGTKISTFNTRDHFNSEVYLNPDTGENQVFIKEQYCQGSKLSASPYANGGTALTTPGGSTFHIICTPTQFTQISSNASSNFHLESDLDFTSLNPFTDSVVNNSFSGKLVGNNHVLQNINIDSTGGSNVGIFTSVSGSIENIELDNIDLDLTNATQSGGLTGYLSGKISGVHVRSGGISIDSDDTDAATKESIGGIVGKSFGSSAKLERVTGENIEIDFETETFRIGGVVGYQGSGATLRLVDINNVDISDNGTNETIAEGRIGGIVGYSDSSKVETVEVTGLNMNLDSLTYVGGIVGFVGGTGDYGISDAKVVGSISVTATDSSYYTTSTKGAVGGAVGIITGDNLYLNSIHVSVTVDTTAHMTGGLAGKSYNGVKISDIVTSGQIDCDLMYCGGVIGTHNNVSGVDTEIKNVYTNINVNNIKGSFSYTGGIGGIISANSYVDVQFKNIASVGRVTSSGTHNGGLFGLLEAVTENLLYFGSQVSGGSSTGSAVGYCQECAMKNTLANIDNAGTDSIRAVATSLSGVYPTCFDNDTVNSDCTNLTEADFLSSSPFTGTDINLTTAGWIPATGSLRPKLQYEHQLSEFGHMTVGSLIDPYLINTPDDWFFIANNSHMFSKVFKLNANLDFTGQQSKFLPLGNNTDPFRGIFLGNDRTISNINYSTASGSMGIFGVIEGSETGPGARININELKGETSYLYLFNVDMSSTSTAGGDYQGILAGDVKDSNTGGHQSTEIFNVVIDSSCTLNATNSNSGGFFGRVVFAHEHSSLKNLHNRADVAVTGARSFVGGISGLVSAQSGGSETRFERLLNSGTVSAGASDFVGGIFGSSNNGKYYFLINEGYVTGNIEVGGIVGDAVGSGTFETLANKSANITANGSGYAGGIMGDLAASMSLSRCYVSDSNITSSTNAGGILGNMGGTISDCYFAGGSLSGSTVDGVATTGSSVSNVQTSQSTIISGAASIPLASFLSHSTMSSNSMDFTIFKIDEGVSKPTFRFEDVLNQVSLKAE